MSRILQFRNRQKERPLSLPLLRQITRHILEQEMKLAGYELGFHLVDPEEMARINWQFLQHEGSTDVITFDYGEGSPADELHGEAYVCVEDAVKQAREFHTTWPEEVARYVIHALLHLRGHDDLETVKRRRMKREENRLVKLVSKRFMLRNLAVTAGNRSRGQR